MYVIYVMCSIQISIPGPDLSGSLLHCTLCSILPHPHNHPCPIFSLSLGLLASLISDPGGLRFFLHLSLVPRPLPLCGLVIGPLPSLSKNPGDLSPLFCLLLGPRPLPLRGLGISLCLGLCSLPCPLHFFPYLVLCLDPCLGLHPLYICCLGLFPGPDPSAGLLYLPLCGVGPLPRPHSNLYAIPLARLGGDPGNLRLCSRHGLGPRPHPLFRLNLSNCPRLSCLPCPLFLFPLLVLEPGPRLEF